MSTRDDDKREYLRLAMVPSCVVDDSAVTPELLTYFVAFCSYASKRNDGRCWVAQAKVAQRMGVTRQAVSKAALRLAELGYIEVAGEWAESATEGKRGKQLTNTYWIDLNKTAIPPERDRSKLPRKRAGVGGRKRRNISSVSDKPPATPAVAPPATPAVAQNLESEYGELMRRGKRTRGEACADIPSSQNGACPEPEPDPPPFRAAPPAFNDFARDYRTRHGIGARYSDIHRAYQDYCEALEAEEIEA